MEGIVLAIDITYNLVMVGIVLAAFVVFWRYRNWMSCISAVVAVVIIAGILAVLTGQMFLAARLLAFGWFFHVPVLLLGYALLAWKVKPQLAAICLLLAVFDLGVAVDAFLIEPTWLEVTEIRLSSSKLDRTVRVAVIADLQTDVIGEYERATLARVMQLSPDLIVMAGDYLQVADVDRGRELRDQLNRYLKQIDFRAPLGVFAVGGNTDSRQWNEIFDGLPVRVFMQTESVALDGLQVTGLGMLDSFDARMRIARSPSYHIVVGHSPNFALGDVKADLLIAGHTHGGQVRFPWIGPLITLTQVPRRWACGVNDIGAGRTLIVSRGLGMERGAAPRLRFLCRPELVVVDITAERHPGQ